MFDAIADQIRRAHDGFGLVLAILLIGGMLLFALSAAGSRLLTFFEILFRGHPPGPKDNK